MSCSVPKLFPGSTIVCIGGGPSLTKEDVEYVRAKARVIAVNDAYKLAPWADVLYACDGKWWQMHKGVPSFTGPKFAMTAPKNVWRVQNLRNTGSAGLELNACGLRTGRNSGYQAINLAVHLGASRILLLGYDMQRTGGKAHWFGNHPAGLKQNSPFYSFLTFFPSLSGPLAQLGIEVINCSRQTALTTFPRMPIEEALPSSMAVAV